MGTVPRFVQSNFEVTHQSGTSGRAAVWAASNDLDDVKNWDDDDDQAVSVALVGAANPTLVLTNHETGTSDTSSNLTTQTKYYCTVDRPQPTTVRLRIFSDSGRSTLVDTLIVDDVDAGRTYRYFFGTNSYNDGTTDALSFDVEHLGLAQGEARDYYYNESWQVVEERRDGSDDAHTEYVWDLRYIDAPVLRWQDANGDGDTSDSGETLYYTNDANMNVTAVVDTSGNVVERYMVDPYGNVTVLDGTTGGQTDWAVDADGASDVANEILYAGYRYDTETALYHVRHRMYHPTLGRWMQRDPIGYVDGPSLYAYLAGCPLGYCDPSGMVLDFWKGVGETFVQGIKDAATEVKRFGGFMADEARETFAQVKQTAAGVAGVLADHAREAEAGARDFGQHMGESLKENAESAARDVEQFADFAGREIDDTMDEAASAADRLMNEGLPQASREYKCALGLMLLHMNQAHTTWMEGWQDFNARAADFYEGLNQGLAPQLPATPEESLFQGVASLGEHIHRPIAEGYDGLIAQAKKGPKSICENWIIPFCDCETARLWCDAYM